LHHLVDRLAANGITIVLSGLKRQVIQVLQRTHLMERVGADNIFATEDMALEAIYQRLGESEHRPLCRQAVPQPA
jgi:SulP family sulfate permease